MPDKHAFHRIESGAHLGAFGDNDLPEPTEAQAKAGNYKMGRVAIHGLKIAIEQPRGTYRTGVDEQTGKRWTSRMAAHYGYISGTRGADGDGVDCFIGPVPQSERVFVINQFVRGAFDEHKVMLGYLEAEDAERAYRNSYDRGWPGLESLIPCSMTQFKWWLKHGDKRRPVRADSLPPDGLEDMKNPDVRWNADAQPEGRTLDHVLYELRCADAGDGLLFDSVSLADILEDAEGVMTLDAMVIPFAKLETKLNQLYGIMERAGGDVKPVAMQITEPFKQRGVANVAAIIELSDGQTISIYFHNPDVNPSKIAPADDLISWKWLLNKKDITIVVAPERGVDLNPREVSRRIVKLAGKNSASFARANAKRAETMGRIDGLKTEISALETELKDVQHELEVAKVEAETKPQIGPEDQAINDSIAAIGDALVEKGWDRTGKYGPFYKNVDGARYKVAGGSSEDAGPRAIHLFKLTGTDDHEHLAEYPLPDNDPEHTADVIDLSSNPRYEAYRRFRALAKQADGALWGVGNPNYYGVLEDEYGDAPDDFMPYENNKMMAAAMGEMAAEFGESYAVQINANKDKPFRVIKVLYPDGRGVGSDWAATADEAYSMVKDAKAVASKETIDPTTPEGYAKADEALLARYQDTLDDIFQGRVVAVRDALKALSWGYPRSGFWPFTKNGAVLSAEFKTARNNNVVGVEYVVTTQNGGLEKFLDDLTKTPEQIAGEIDAAVPAVGDEPSEPEITPQQRQNEAFIAVFDALVVNHGWTRHDGSPGGTFVGRAAKMFEALGPSGSVTPNGERRITVWNSQGSELIATLGDTVIVSETVSPGAYDAAASADRINAAVEAFVASERAKQNPEPEPVAVPDENDLTALNALKRAAPRGPIKSDDPEAIDKLRAKVAYLTAYGNMMRKANKFVRKQDRAGLAEMGFSGEVLEGLFKPDFAGRIGFPDYEMTNNNAEIRRAKGRLEELEAALIKEQEAKVAPTPEPPTEDPAKVAAKELMQSIIDSSADPLTADLDALEAAYTANADDAEIAALFEQAVEIVLAAVGKATEGV